MDAGKGTTGRSASEDYREVSRHAGCLRDAWLNPPDQSAEVLKKLTLTNLYNKPPQWLLNAHAELDRAVAAAYGWPDSLSDQGILSRLLALNAERAAAAV